MRELLRENYDGYHFSREGEDIFQSVQSHEVLRQDSSTTTGMLSSTSTYLIHQMQHFHTDVTTLDDMFAFSSSFDRPTEKMSDALPLLYQSGYLTIKKYDLAEQWILSRHSKQRGKGRINGESPSHLFRQER